MDDLISRQAAIDYVDDVPYIKDHPNIALLWKAWVEQLPSAQPEQNCVLTVWGECSYAKTGCSDCEIKARITKALLPSAQPIQTASNYLQSLPTSPLLVGKIPSAQPTVHPQRTCVNCGRTVNNGGWYADGGTRCPIEEHYALPKDGYCHLWEKRNVTDDDYPERREDA